MTTFASMQSPFEAKGRPRAPDVAPKAEGICAMDAGALAEAIAGRRLSAREVAAAFLRRIEALNGRFNAVVSLRAPEAILAEADAADAAVRAGEPLGALHGLPIAIKDLMATKGLATSFGSPLFADFVPEADGLAAARIRQAGAIVIGKTNTPEFGLGSHTFNPVFGATRNAFDPARSAGGSSGGAAVALALRMLPLADGSDMGGSLRNPAGWNNVFGLRPAAGRVPSLTDADPFSVSLSTEGPMARNAADLARLLDVLAGPAPHAPLSLPRPAQPFSQIAPLAPGRRIGWLGDWGGHLAMESGLTQIGRRALARLEDAGVEVVELPLPAMAPERLWQAFVTLRHHVIATRFAPLLNHPRAGEMKPEMRWEIEGGLKLGVPQLREAVAVRAAWYAELMTMFGEIDFLALPSAQLWPFAVEENWPRAIAGRAMDSYHRWMEVVAAGSLSGLPVLAMPAGFVDGLPAGIQMIGRPQGEAELLSLAALYEGCV